MKQANSSVPVQYSERRSLASCIVSRQAGLTQGFELHAVPVISPPSGRVGTVSSQSDTACCMDLRVGGLPLHLAETVWMLTLPTSHRGIKHLSSLVFWTVKYNDNMPWPM